MWPRAELAIVAAGAEMGAAGGAFGAALLTVGARAAPGTLASWHQETLALPRRQSAGAVDFGTLLCQSISVS